MKALFLFMLCVSIGASEQLAAKTGQRTGTSSKQRFVKKAGRSSVRSTVKRRTKKSALTYLPQLRTYVPPAKKKRLVKKSSSTKKMIARTTPKSNVRTLKKRGLSVRQAQASSYKPEKIFSWPVDPKNFWLSSPFGPRTIRGKGGFHGGVDLAAPTGTDVYAAGSGKILESRYSPGYGNFIVVVHDNGYKTRYAHLSKSLVRAGQLVDEGDLIGKVGATGRVVKRKSSSSGAHLHFEVYRNGSWVDPVGYIR
jgi:murein DD-endopeptidase MepM/ murein hydrolase activator NlpD